MNITLEDVLLFGEFNKKEQDLILKKVKIAFINKLKFEENEKRQTTFNQSK